VNGLFGNVVLSNDNNNHNKEDGHSKRPCHRVLYQPDDPKHSVGKLMNLSDDWHAEWVGLEVKHSCEKKTAVVAARVIYNSVEDTVGRAMEVFCFSGDRFHTFRSCIIPGAPYYVEVDSVSVGIVMGVFRQQ
jgi:hypothetical protein